MKTVRSRPRFGPALVALGAAGWGTEVAWRRRLTTRLAPYPLVLIEHLLQILYTLPLLIRHAWLWKKIPRRALFWVFISGGIGSALGTVSFTAALSPGSDVNLTAALVLLNLQPVVSTLAGAILFHEVIRRGFYPWAAIAILSGAAIALYDDGATLKAAHLSSGFLYVAATIILWGFATAAGRGAMREMPLQLAAPLRLWAGLFVTSLVIALRALAGKGGIDIAPLADPAVIRDLVLLTSLSGVIPLFIYFAGLKTTSAAIAGYCEMAYTVSSTVISWAVLGHPLNGVQVLAAIGLVAAIVMLNRAQEPAAGAP